MPYQETHRIYLPKNRTAEAIEAVLAPLFLGPKDAQYVRGVIDQSDKIRPLGHHEQQHRIIAYCTQTQLRIFTLIEPSLASAAHSGSPHLKPDEYRSSQAA